MKMILGITLILALWSLTPLASSNYEVAAKGYDVIKVKNGDSVWSIAAKFASDKEDIRNLVMAIRETNHLNSNAQIYAGQELKVPVAGINQQ